MFETATRQSSKKYLLINAIGTKVYNECLGYRHMGENAFLALDEYFRLKIICAG